MARRKNLIEPTELAFMMLEAVYKKGVMNAETHANVKDAKDAFLAQSTSLNKEKKSANM